MEYISGVSSFFVGSCGDHLRWYDLSPEQACDVHSCVWSKECGAHITWKPGEVALSCESGGMDHAGPSEVACRVKAWNSRRPREVVISHARAWETWGAWSHVDTVEIYSYFVLNIFALLDVLGKKFVMLCGECWIKISELLKLSSLRFYGNAQPSFFPSLL